MSRVVILLVVVLAVAAVSKCPSNCACKEPGSDVCALCNQANKDPATQCQKCLDGYDLDATGACVKPTVKTCPSNCQCRGFVPWTCTSCTDPNADFATNCKECNTGYSHNAKGICTADVVVQDKTCPAYCICAGFVPWSCTRCPDQKKTVQSKCKQCIDGYVLNRRTNTCVSLSPCPQNCNCSGFNPAGCVSCLKPGFDPATKCTKCLPNYKYNYDSYSGYASCRPICSKGCNCKEPGGCDGCIDSMLAVLETKCTTCKDGYKMKPEGICTLATNPIQTPGPVNPPSLPGGVNPQPDPNTVDGFPAVDTYVRAEHPELAGAVVKTLSTQVVAGLNYYVTYENATTVFTVVVWVKSWENFMQITSFTSKAK